MQNWIRLLVFLLAALLLYWQVFAHEDTRGLFRQLALSLDQRMLMPLLLVACLTWVNWGLEALKWRMLMKPITTMSFWRAFMATLAGTSLTLITPNRTGEYVGRVLFIPDGKRLSAAVATALGSIAQLVVTLVLGCAALIMLYFTGSALPISGTIGVQVLMILASTVAITSLLLYFNPRLIHLFLSLLPFLSRWERQFQVLMAFSKEQLMRVLFISGVRYMVFVMQFVIVLLVMDTGLTASQAILAVPVIYLVTTLLPTVLLTELGVRGSAAIAMLAPLGAAKAPVLLATFTIWTLNLLIPALVGIGILLVMRYGGVEKDLLRK